jgi:hypothetical protein
MPAADVTTPLPAPEEGSSGGDAMGSSSGAFELAPAVSPEPSDAPTVEDGPPAAQSATAASTDSSVAQSAGAASSRLSASSPDSVLRSTSLRSDRMRLGWLVAVALLLALGLAICTPEPDGESLSGKPVATTDAGYGPEVRG